MKNLSRLLAVFAVLILLAGGTGAAETKTDKPPEKTKILASYFYTTYRCSSCVKIEKWSHEAIKASFPKALEEDRLVWRAVNVDEPENKHFLKDYKLFTKALVISEIKGEKEIKWKNLDKIWQLLGDQEKFSAYVTQEVRKYLEN